MRLLYVLAITHQLTVILLKSLGKRRTVELPNLVAMATSLQHMKVSPQATAMLTSP